jgi:Diguanylate cyclase, GGDEF domain
VELLPWRKVKHRTSVDPRLSAVHRLNPRKETLESLVSSTFASIDSELDKILRALCDLSRTFKSGVVDSAAVDATLKQAAIWAVQQSLVDREIHSLAITDDLTGLLNRRGFLASATQQLKLANRDKQHVLLFFLDVDNLKAINDSFGHREGDLALVRTADVLDETFATPMSLRALEETSLLSLHGRLPAPIFRPSCPAWRKVLLKQTPKKSATNCHSASVLRATILMHLPPSAN